MSTNRRPVKFGSLAAGVNNRLEPTQLDHGERGAPATYLYGADNVDINAAGYLKRRRGITSAIVGRAHSLWGDAAGGFAVIDGDLTQLTPAGATLAQTVVRTGMPNLPVSYSRGSDGHVYWSNGRDIGRIVGQADRPIVTPALASNPFVSVTSGALPRGRYLIAFTVLDDDGESASTVPRQLDVPENGGLHIEGLPGSNVAAYLSGPNGDILTLAGSGADAGLDVLSLPAGGVRCQTLLKSAMPPGAIVRHYNGCLLVAAGNTLHVSLPYLYGLTDAASRYLP
ncbi:MAG: hypothetical protein ABI040_09100, partial [Rhodoferax sp.]